LSNEERRFWMTCLSIWIQLWLKLILPYALLFQFYVPIGPSPTSAIIFTTLNLCFCHLQPKVSYLIQVTSDSPRGLSMSLCGQNKMSVAATCHSPNAVLADHEACGLISRLCLRESPAKSWQPELSSTTNMVCFVLLCSSSP
jgi:hypothetical protein